MKVKDQLTGVAGRTLLCAAMGLPALACAQHSGVQLYGVISTGIQYANNVGGDHRFALANGGMMPPRFGIRGTEDLGGGTQALFLLENGFSIKNGASLGGMFGRQAYVGLKDNTYGTVTMGRQYEEMTNSLYWATAANIFAGIGAHIGDSDNMFFTNRFNNSVRYVSPQFGGMTLAGSYAFSDSTSFNNNNAFSFSANYASGPTRLGVGFTQFNRRSNAVPPNLTEGAVDSTGWGFSSPFVVSPGGAGVDQQRIIGVGGGYDLGIVRLTGNYTNVLFNYSDTTGLRLQNAEIAAHGRVMPALTVGLAYVYTFGEYSAGSKPRWHQLSLGTLYSLSKRTDLFLTAIYQRAAGDAKFAQVYSMPAASGKSQAVFQVGIRHFF